MKHEPVLLTAIAIGPVAWFLSMQANFALSPLACTDRNKLFLYVISGISLLVTAWAGVVSLSHFRLPEKQAAGQLTSAHPVRHALAIAGLGLSVLSFLVILAQALPNLMLAGCE